jgi:predicted transcriptional regulator
MQGVDLRFRRLKYYLTFTVDHPPQFAAQCMQLSYMEVTMLKAASLTVRVKPDTRTRLDNLARITRRSKSYVIEEALEQYLDVNEWQIKGIQDALLEADSPGAVFEDHDEVLAKWEAKVARKMV